MTKNELRELLLSGRTLDSIFRFKKGQECMIFKAEDFSPGAEIIYIPDIDLNEIPVDKALLKDGIQMLEVLACCYTGDDFIEECNGNEEHAKELFEYVDWQHPSSAFPEMEFDFD